MPYTIQEVDADRCPHSVPVADRVDDSERVARLLHSGIADDGKASERTFQIEHLQLGLKAGLIKEPDHDCGNSGGISCHRTPPLNVPELEEKSAQIAALKPGRTALGFVAASVGTLRGIRAEGDNQVVFVIADGSEEDPTHTIIRMDPGLTGGLAKKVRREIVMAFSAEADAAN
jgi:hypothetical protein